ncbi:glycosyl transferase family 2 [Geobacter metallireducens RCH3]|uniref:Undecaprenyl-phosphate glycosyltransferase, DPM1-like family n=1 Tax=Geobacter metallireducens (strain ATCC 53774 / DSM 7210 / GS-15) TaxID=269799 RepID=Q39RL4_GEOMG|nr:glycosyltransferase family 2 protein [Geobacter metallireducens]ABB33110.1 undecaprenyl-phosphate glycosyltransferase, DPM1-like family [Geobacter metallireducens GS-15]EHP87109.1 glycosyl transferase family 2 [Geobacter metallireducens RCH3]
MKLSIVIPIYNEEENIPPLYGRVTEALAGTGIDYELILVDDGSSDGSFPLLRQIAERDSRVKVIRFRRNFGQTAAMAAGFDAARGEVVVPMDGDLQNDPADIPMLLSKINEGYDVVSGWRKDRQDTFINRRLPSIIANGLISRMTGVHLHDYGCTLKAYRREVLDGVNLYGEMHRFVPALASQVGARVTELPVRHHPRLHGTSKYGISRTMRVVLDLMTVKFLLAYSTKPIQLFGKWGIYTLFAGFLSGGATLYFKFFEHINMNRNPLLILTAFLLFMGVQFIVLGLLGELNARTYYEAQGKPIYVIRERINVGDRGPGTGDRENRKDL